MIKLINSILMQFKPAFSRNATFQWFVVVIIGFIVSGDGIGITSIIRELSIDPKHYESLIHFFRSSAWEINKLSKAWVSIVKNNAPILTANGLNILVGDGVKQSKEGKKMPGVKKLHQESENSSKAKYIMGYMYGIVSVLVGRLEKQFALPLHASIQDGVSIIRNYADPLAEQPSHVVQVISQAGDIAKELGKSVILLDRYFLSVPTLKKSIEFLDEKGEQLLQLVTKAKISLKAYTDAPPYSGKGRPRLKGDSVKLKDLFTTAADKFVTADLYIYGKVQTVQYYCIDLLWGAKLYKKLRFVLVKTEMFLPSILVSTSLSMSPIEIIELYSYRYKIELSFKTLKHTVFGFGYHFWSIYMPKLDRYHKERNIAALESITDEFSQKKITSALKAIEGFVICSCIACGILQILTLKFSNSFNFSKVRWLRTKTSAIVSEDTIAYYFRKNFFRIIRKSYDLDIVKIIISKQHDFLDGKRESA